jgi:hypothetical protein
LKLIDHSECQLAFRVGSLPSWVVGSERKVKLEMLSGFVIGCTAHTRDLIYVRINVFHRKDTF